MNPKVQVRNMASIFRTSLRTVRQIWKSIYHLESDASLLIAANSPYVYFKITLLALYHYFHLRFLFQYQSKFILPLWARDYT